MNPVTDYFSGDKFEITTHSLLHKTLSSVTNSLKTPPKNKVRISLKFFKLFVSWWCFVPFRARIRKFASQIQSFCFGRFRANHTRTTELFFITVDVSWIGVGIVFVQADSNDFQKKIETEDSTNSRTLTRQEQNLHKICQDLTDLVLALEV